MSKLPELAIDDNSREIVLQAAFLINHYKYREAINLIESNIDEIHDLAKLPALIQAFEASREANLTNKAK